MSSLPALLIALFAFALRMWKLDSLLFFHDHGVPHGLGVHIVELIRAGRWSELPLQSFASGIKLMNPPAISYFWALVAAFDADPYCAVVVSVAMSTAAVCIMYRIGREMFGARMGVLTAFFGAGSLWSAYFARGTWMQGQTEFFACICAWLVWTGAKGVHAKRMFWAGLAAGVFAQTYLAAFGLIAQVTIAIIAAWRRLSPLLRRAAFVGFACAVMSMLLYLVTTVTHAEAVTPALQWAATRGTSDELLLENPFGLRIDIVAPVRAAQFISNGEIGAALISSFAAVQQIQEWAAICVLIIGLAIAVRNARRSLAHRQVLLWFAAPVVGAFAGTIFFPQMSLGNRWYLLLISPAQFVLAALGVDALITAAGRFMKNIRIVVFAVATLWCGVAAMRIDLHAESEYQFQIRNGWFDQSPLRVQREFAQVWKTQCTQINNEQLVLWQTSLLGRSAGIAQGRAHLSGENITWQTSPAGGDCLTATASQPAPPFANVILRQQTTTGELLTYRSQPVHDDESLLHALHIQSRASDQLNIGWRLIGFDAPQHVRAGEKISVTQVWKIEAVPAEPHDDWCYSVFASWYDAAGRRFDVISSAEQSPLVCGRFWQPGDFVINRTVVTIPIDSAAGPGRMDLTLWDNGLARNAAYFAADGKVIIAREHEMTIEGAIR